MSSSSISASSVSSSSASSESSFSTGGNSVNSAITQDIIDTLKTIRKSNGYNYDVEMVERERTLLQLNARFPFILVIENEPSDIDHLYLREKEYVIWFFGPQNDEVQGVAAQDLNSESAYFNRNIIADINKALLVDIYRKEYALNTDIKPGTHDLYQEGEFILFGTWCLCKVTTNIDIQDQFNLR